MEGRRLYVLNGLFIVAVGVLFWLLATWTTPWNVQRYVGTVLAVLGISFVAVARYQLGNSFSIKPEAHQLVTNGIYSRIRNRFTCSAW
jgi:protein-S-isoprenylcysteine O-methyltransferase Ste14